VISPTEMGTNMKKTFLPNTIFWIVLVWFISVESSESRRYNGFSRFQRGDQVSIILKRYFSLKFLYGKLW